MATPVSFDQQYCPIARGLDILGDRWTILIVREVAAGQQRFSDIQRNLPGIAATVLTERLRSMSASGLIVAEPVSGSGTRKRYVLGPEGKRALPVLASLVQFGMPILETPEADTLVRPVMGVRAGILSYFDATAASHIIETYEVRIGDQVFSVNSRAEMTLAAASPDLVVEFPTARTLVDIRQGRTTFDQLSKRGVIKSKGSVSALDHFRSIYRLNPTAPELA